MRLPVASWSWRKKLLNSRSSPNPSASQPPLSPPSSLSSSNLSKPHLTHLITTTLSSFETMVITSTSTGLFSSSVSTSLTTHSLFVPHLVSRSSITPEITSIPATLTHSTDQGIHRQDRQDHQDRSDLYEHSGRALSFDCRLNYEDEYKEEEEEIVEAEDMTQSHKGKQQPTLQKLDKRIVMNPPQSFLAAAAEQKASSATPESVNSPVVIGQDGQAAMIGSNSVSSASSSGITSGEGSTTEISNSQSQIQGQGGETGSTGQTSTGAQAQQGQEAMSGQVYSLALDPVQTQAIVVGAATASGTVVTSPLAASPTSMNQVSIVVSPPSTQITMDMAVSSASTVASTTSTQLTGTTSTFSTTGSSTVTSSVSSSSSSPSSSSSSSSSSTSSFYSSPSLASSTSTYPSSSASSMTSSSSVPFTRSPVFIALIVLACLAVIALIATLISCLFRRNCHRRRLSTYTSGLGTGWFGGFYGGGYGHDHDDGLSDLVESFERKKSSLSRSSTRVNQTLISTSHDLNGMRNGNGHMVQVNIDEAEVALHRRSGLFASDPSASPFLHSGTADLPPALPAVTVMPGTISPFDAAHGYGTPPAQHGFQSGHLYGVTGPLEVRNATPSELGMDKRGGGEEMEKEYGTPRQDEASKSPRYMGVDGSGLEVPWSRPTLLTPSSYLSPGTGYAGSPLPSPPVTDGGEILNSGCDQHFSPTGANATPEAPTSGSSWATNLRNSLFAAINNAKTPASFSSMGMSLGVGTNGEDSFGDRFTRTVLPLYRGSTRRLMRRQSISFEGAAGGEKGSEASHGTCGTFGEKGASRVRSTRMNTRMGIGSEDDDEKGGNGAINMLSRPSSDDGQTTTSSFTPPQMSRATSRDSRISMPTPVIRSRAPLRGASRYAYGQKYSMKEMGGEEEESEGSSVSGDWEEGADDGEAGKLKPRLAGGTRALGVRQ